MKLSWEWLGATALLLVLARGSVTGCATGDTAGFGGDETTTDHGGHTSSGGGVGGGVGGSGGVGGTSPCAIDCTQIQAPQCQVAQCNAKTGQCEVVPDTDGSACEDNEFCTVDDTCLAGVCQPGGPNDCGMNPAPCEQATCDESTDSCSLGPKTNGEACTDPSDLCLTNTTCLNGLCIGDPKDCFFSPVPDDCHVSQCNPQNGQCEPVPGNEGLACVDQTDLCTVNKTCAAGSCQGGSPKDCSAFTQGCVLGVCDQATGQCTTQSVNNGDPCDDLDSCTTGEICQTGTCGGGNPVTQCLSGDSCCPANCNEINDLDCALPFNQPAYNAVTTFIDQLASTTMMVAWDGTNLWSCSGGSNSGERLAEYTAAGVLVQKFSPGLDFRAVFTKGDGAGPVYERAYSQMQLRVQTSPGVFTADVTLAGSVDSQSGVVWDAKNSIFVAQKGGTLYRWNASGGSLASVSLTGFGTLNSENTYPQDSRVATVKGFYLTYSNGVLSAWDDLGARIDTTVLNAAGSSFNSHFGLSYAQGKVWVVDDAGQTWRGYNVGL